MPTDPPAHKGAHGEALTPGHDKRSLRGVGKLYMCVGVPSPETCHELEWKQEFKHEKS